MVLQRYTIRSDQVVVGGEATLSVVDLPSGQVEKRIELCNDPRVSVYAIAALPEGTTPLPGLFFSGSARDFGFRRLDRAHGPKPLVPDWFFVRFGQFIGVLVLIELTDPPVFCLLRLRLHSFGRVTCSAGLPLGAQPIEYAACL